MGGILDKLDEWLRGLLAEGIKGNLTGMFDSVNTKVGEIAGEVGQTPQGWNSGVFSMIQNLSETVIVPIAGVILTFVMCYELIQLVTERNNLHDIDTWMFFKWIFKTFCAVLIVTNTYQAEKIDGEWVQKLTIHYNCIGALFIPDTDSLPVPDVTVNTRRGVYVTYEPAQNEQ